LHAFSDNIIEHLTNELSSFKPTSVLVEQIFSGGAGLVVTKRCSLKQIPFVHVCVWNLGGCEKDLNKF